MRTLDDLRQEVCEVAWDGPELHQIMDIVEAALMYINASPPYHKDGPGSPWANLLLSRQTEQLHKRLKQTVEALSSTLNEN